MRRHSLPLLGILVSMTLSACAPDPQGEFDAFSDRVGPAPVVDLGGGGQFADVTGTFFLEIDPTSAYPAGGKATIGILEVTMQDGLDGGAVMSWTVQLLDAETLEPVGEVQEVNGTVVDSEGSFAAQLVDFAVPGESNQITHGDFTIAKGTMSGAIHTEDLFCGNFTFGKTSSGVSLVGSPFSGKRLAEGWTTDDLPAAPWTADCGMPPASPDPSTP